MSNEQLKNKQHQVNFIFFDQNHTTYSIEKIVGELKTLIVTDKLKPICHYYNFYVQQILKKLDRSPVVPTHLEDVKWSVQLSLGNDSLHKILEPTGILQFNLTDPKEENVLSLFYFFRDFPFVDSFFHFSFFPVRNLHFSWNLTMLNFMNSLMKWKTFKSS